MVPSGENKWQIHLLLEEEIMRAAKIANAHEFITQMPGGYETRVGEREIRYPGGQR